MLRLGIVGVGQFGQNHARILSQSDKCEFMGLYDKDKKRAKEIGERLSCKIFPDFDSLLEVVDALLIVVTTISHYDLAKRALEAGIHVFIEKPITSDLWQAEELLELASAKNLNIQVGHIERFNPLVLELEDKIKDPIFIECHRIAPFTPRGSDVPVVLELMIHDIDLILAFVKSKVKHISASGSSVMTKSIDIANARIEFENGAVANVTASRISNKNERRIRLFQKNGYVSVDFANRSLIHVRPGKEENNCPIPGMHLEEKCFTQGDALEDEIRSFIRAVKSRKAPEVSGQMGRDALKMALNITQQIQKSSMIYSGQNS